MTRFHTDEYINFLSRVTPDNARRLTYLGSRFLVGDDIPPFEGVFEFSSISAGGSIGTSFLQTRMLHPPSPHAPLQPPPTVSWKAARTSP